MSRKQRHMAATRPTQPTVDTLAAPAAPTAPGTAPPVVRGPGAAITGRYVPANWDTFEFGPYEKFPTLRQMVMDGYLMQRYDPTIGAALNILRMLVGSHLGKYKHQDKKIEEFVRGDFDKLHGGLRRTVGSLLSCFWAGFAVAEKRWATESNAWHIESLGLLHPLTFFPRSGGGPQANMGIALDPKEGRVTEVVQQPWQLGEEPVAFPVEQVVYWPFMAQTREEVTGRRLTDMARRSWFMRVKMETYWGIFQERFAHPTPIFIVPTGQQVDENGNIITNAQFYANFGTGLAPGKVLAIESDDPEKFMMKFLESGSGKDAAYERVCDYYNAELWKSVLMSPLLLEEPAHGSRAQASIVLELTMLLVEAIQDELGATLVNQGAKPLIGYNFGESIDDFGEWRFEALQKEDLEFLSTVTERIIRSGAIQPTEADEASFREKFAEAGFVAAEEVPEEQRAAAAEKQLQLPVGYGLP